MVYLSCFFGGNAEFGDEARISDALLQMMQKQM